MVYKDSKKKHGGKDVDKEEKVLVGSFNALFLFGGADKVFEELTRIVKERIENRSPSELYDLEHYLGLDKGILFQIKSGKKEVDKKIFLALKSALRISLHEALGEPEKLEDNELKKYWEEKWKSKPMRLVAHDTVVGMAKNPGNPIDLEAYVTLRAIGEFYRL